MEKLWPSPVPKMFTVKSIEGQRGEVSCPRWTFKGRDCLKLRNAGRCFPRRSAPALWTGEHRQQALAHFRMPPWGRQVLSPTQSICSRHWSLVLLCTSPWSSGGIQEHKHTYVMHPPSHPARPAIPSSLIPFAHIAPTMRVQSELTSTRATPSESWLKW